MYVVSFDTETRGFNWWDPDHRAFLATYADAENTWSADLSDDTQVQHFISTLDKADLVVGHNVKFDIHQVRYTLGYDPIWDREFVDTETMSKLLHPEGAAGTGFGHGLKALAKLYLDPNATDEQDAIVAMGKELGLNMSKDNMTHAAYHLIYQAYPTIMTEYALADARYTHDLWALWAGKFDDRLEVLLELEMNVMRDLIESEEYGIATDQDRVQVLKQQYSVDRDAIYAKLANTLGEQALGGKGSEEALIEALLAQGVPLTETTETGKLATNKFALQPFAKDFPVIEDLFEYRLLNRFLSTYIGALEGNDVIHPNFIPIGAWTGRMACRSPNMQNFPARSGPEIRSVLVPRPGHAFVVCDFESIEMRLLAYYLGNPEFRQLVVERDSHAWMASKIWGGLPEDYAKGGPNSDKRQLAKNMLFAITYGAGAPRIQSMLLDAGFQASRDYAKSIISTIKGSLPGYYKLMKRIRSKIEEVGYINTILGRKNPVSKDKAYVGMNALIQGSAADIMKLAWVELTKAARGYGGVPVMVVHDEAVVEVPEEYADACLEAVITAMECCIDVDPPLSVSGGWTTISYGDAK